MPSYLSKDFLQQSNADDMRLAARRLASEAQLAGIPEPIDPPATPPVDFGGMMRGLLATWDAPGAGATAASTAQQPSSGGTDLGGLIRSLTATWRDPEPEPQVANPRQTPPNPPTAGLTSMPQASAIAAGGGRAARYAAQIEQVAREEGVPADVLAGLLDTEESDEASVSPAGARGVMQVVPGQGYDLPGEDASDPLTSIRQGARAVKDKFRQTGSWEEAGRAYFGYGVDAGGMDTDTYGRRYDENRRRYRGTTPEAQAAPGTGSEADRYDVAFGFNQAYDQPFSAAIPRHRGVDLVIRGAEQGGRGQPVRAFRGGTVYAVTSDPNGGNGLIVATGDPQAPYDYYGHFDATNVRQGQQIAPGDPIGVLGASGTEGFPHLHYEVRRAVNGDPQDQLIDPTPYLRGASAAPTAGASAPAPAAPAPAPAAVPEPRAAGRVTIENTDTGFRTVVSPAEAEGFLRPVAPGVPTVWRVVDDGRVSRTSQIGAGDEGFSANALSLKGMPEDTPLDDGATEPTYGPPLSEAGPEQPQYEVVGAETNAPVTNPLQTAEVDLPRTVDVVGAESPSSLPGPGYPAEATPRTTAQETYLDQSVPSPPGWQALVDAAGNVVDWVRERVADTADSAYQALEPARQAAASLDGPKGYGQVQSFGPGEPDYVAPGNAVTRALTTPIRPPERPEPLYGPFDLSDPNAFPTQESRNRFTSRQAAADASAIPYQAAEAGRQAVESAARSFADAIRAGQEGRPLAAAGNALWSALQTAGLPWTVAAGTINQMLPEMNVGGVGIGDAATSIDVLRLGINGVNALRRVPGALTPERLAAVHDAPGNLIRGAGAAVDRGIEAARAALEENAARTAAADARMAEQGSTTAPGVLGVTMGTDRQSMVRSRIVPPEVADTLDFPLRVPDDPRFVHAVEAAGGTVDPEKGATFPVIRAQGPEAAGKTATRGGPFYEAGTESSYVSQNAANDPNKVGGTQVIGPAPTRFRSPLVLDDAPGGHQGFEAGMRLLAKDSIQQARQQADEAMQAYRAAVEKHGGDAVQMRARRDAIPVGDDTFEVYDRSGNLIHTAASRSEAQAWAFENGHPSPDIVRAPAPRNQPWLDADAALQEVFRAAYRVREANRAAEIAQKIPTSSEIDTAIREARRAGPEGSPERAQALKDLVARYGGDPDLIDDLLAIRGADASESAWAIKENILTSNARKQGYDGVLTVQDSVDKAAADKSPAVWPFIDAVQQANKEKSEAGKALDAVIARGRKTMSFEAIQQTPAYQSAFERAVAADEAIKVAQ